jgi:hypothetical protein
VSIDYINVPASYENLTSEQLAEPERIDTRTLQAGDVDGPLAVQVATSPFNRGEIVSLGGRRPTAFSPPASPIQYNVQAEVSREETMRT